MKLLIGYSLAGKLGMTRISQSPQSESIENEITLQQDHMWHRIKRTCVMMGKPQ